MNNEDTDEGQEAISQRDNTKGEAGRSGEACMVQKLWLEAMSDRSTQLYHCFAEAFWLPEANAEQSLPLSRAGKLGSYKQ